MEEGVGSNTCLSGSRLVFLSINERGQKTIECIHGVKVLFCETFFSSVCVCPCVARSQCKIHLWVLVKKKERKKVCKHWYLPPFS